MEFPFDYGELSLVNLAIAVLLYAPLTYVTVDHYFLRVVAPLKQGSFHRQMFILSLISYALLLIVIAFEAIYFFHLQKV